MVLLRSLIFLLFQLIFTPLFSLCALFTFPLSAKTRYAFISQWAKVMLWALRVVCGIRHEIRGQENIPAGPCIIVCKHQSAWETLALQLIFPPQVWVLKRELLFIPFFGWALALTSPIAIKRSDGKGAMKQLLKQGRERLQEGFCVVIYPEGTRIPYGQRGKYKVGGAMLANHNPEFPLVPVAHNAGRLWGREAFIKQPGVVTVSIGQPIVVAGLKTDQLNQQIEAWIEDEVARLPG